MAEYRNWSGARWNYIDTAVRLNTIQASHNLFHVSQNEVDLVSKFLLRSEFFHRILAAFYLDGSVPDRSLEAYLDVT